MLKWFPSLFVVTRPILVLVILVLVACSAASQEVGRSVGEGRAQPASRAGSDVEEKLKALKDELREQAKRLEEMRALVTDQQRQSARLYRLIKKLNPDAPGASYHGYWRLSAEMHARTRLPFALATFGLVPDDYDVLARAMHVEPAPSAWCTTLNVTR